MADALRPLPAARVTHSDLAVRGVETRPYSSCYEGGCFAKRQRSGCRRTDSVAESGVGVDRELLDQALANVARAQALCAEAVRLLALAEARTRPPAVPLLPLRAVPPPEPESAAR